MSSMGYMEKLLDGVEVEWKSLVDVIKLEKGKQLNKELLSENGPYPAYNGGISHSGFTDTYNYTENTIIVSQGGASAGFVNFVTSNFYANAHCYVVLPRAEVVENRYVFHFLKLNQEKLTNKQHGAGIPALRTSEILEIPIPIPCPENPGKSLEIQTEIVRILDAFTELTAKLTAELTARKKQYNYYRDQLLSFDEGDVEWKTLGEVYKFQYGMGNTIPTLGGEYPVFGSNGIVGTHNEFNSEDSPVIGHIGAYAGIVNWGAGKHFVTYNGVICKLINKLVNPTYAYYQLLKQDFNSMAKSASHPFVSYDALNKVSVPIPSPAEQARIVAILDKFDTLTNSISEGLPREIELRQKQYEYYRDLLLSFPKPKEVAA